VSKDIAGVNMRLTKGSFRELHWHLADEWALMLTGKARVTLFTSDNAMFVDDVDPGDLWLFPAGAPHSIQALGEDGCEFLLVFNQGNFSEESTLLLSDWLKHTPPEILQQNFGLTAKAIENLPKGEPLYIFRSEEPAKTLPRYDPAVPTERHALHDNDGHEGQFRCLRRPPDNAEAADQRKSSTKSDADPRIGPLRVPPTNLRRRAGRG
jgi:oxalate decarboxylase family bicupin protein